MKKITSEEAAQISLLPFWSNGRQKLRSILLVAAAVFVLTLPYSIYSIFLKPLFLFPIGLAFFANVDYEALYWGYSGLPFVLIWILYIGMAAVIVRSNKKTLVISLYVILILLLILNVAGCQIVAPKILSESF